MGETVAFPKHGPKAELADYALFLHRLADKADAVARQYFGAPLAVEQKADASPVTLADQEIEMALVEAIRTHYPQHGIYGEETARVNPEASWQWVIDPIDGTRAFIAGKPTFTTLIAICYEGTPLLGIISQPIKKERWLGGDSSQPLAQEDLPDSFAEAMIATTSMSYFSASEMRAFRQLEQQTRSVLLNHDAYAFGLLANGGVDIVVEAKLKPWDFAALVPIVEQSGGIITDWEGKPLTLESDGRVLAARDIALHAQAIGILTTP
ncbi:MAG: histidinol phosphate phosphatase [Rickettsiales bacterium]|nr:histidinol phosphate phosphatase [Rickettsiales bacterium]|tara:strand:- start:1800 stop:2597 length:798 start_codon:yes stop_codon:yes gene_type:complete